ncbi:putative holin-like toxin [Lactobacillus mellis]|nr:putative holin-like toxin [Bombilactobacillus mellis]
MSVKDTLQLMLAFGTFTIELIALVVELIKISKKKITAYTLTGSGY